MPAKKKKSTAGDDQVAFLERIKAEWLATIDALVDPLMIIDQDYTIRKANQALAKLSNKKVTDVIGKKCYQMFAGRESPCVGCKLGQSKTAKSEQFHLEGIRGKTFFEVTSQPIELESEHNVVHIYRDRTEHRKMANQLLQKEKLASIGQLAGGVAHELNNPIGGILVFSQMLLMETDKKDAHYQDIKEIEEAAKRCRDIVRNLLDFARKSPGEDSNVKSEVDVHEAFEKALKFAKLGFKHKKVTIEENWDPKLPKVLGDTNKLTQVFLNLLQNAEQASEDKKAVIKITGQLEKSSGMVSISIQDNGGGIDPKNMKKIFDPFFTTKDPGSGTGLGLSICYNIVEEIGGQIDVESEKGEGAKFTVRIPAKAAIQKSA